MTEFEKYCDENNIMAGSCSSQKSFEYNVAKTAFEAGQKSVADKWHIYSAVKPPFVPEKQRTKDNVVTIQEWFICIVDFKDGNGKSRMPLAYNYDRGCFEFEEEDYDGYVLAWRPLPEIPEEMVKNTTGGQYGRQRD